MELRDYLRMLRKGWYWFIVTFVGVFLVDTFLVRPKDPEYLARARMLVRMEQYGVEDLLNPYASTRRHYTTEETKVTNLVEGPVTDIAVDLLLGERPYESTTPSGEPTVPKALQEGAEEQMKLLKDRILAQNPEADFRAALMDLLERSVKVSEKPSRSRDQMETLTATSPVAGEAVAFVNAQAEAAFLYDRDGAQQLVKNALRQAQDQIREATQKQDRLQRERLAFAKTHGVFNLASKEEILQKAIQELDDDRATALNELELDKERIKQWLEEKARERIAGDRSFPAGELESVALSELTARLADAQKAVDRLLYGSPAHKESSPELIRARAQVGSLEKKREEHLRWLAQQKRNEEDRGIAELIRKSRLREAQIQKDLERRKEKEAELARLAEIHVQASEMERALEFAQSEVATLADRLKGLESLETQTEGAVVFYTAAEDAQPILAEGERAITRIFVLILVAFIFGLGIVYFLEYVDTRLVNLNDIRKYLSLPILGIIHKEKGSACLLDLPLDHVLAEKTNTAATLVQSALAARESKALMVVSTNEGEGKTTVVANLGLALARKGQKVILVDADLRRPDLHATFGVENVYGLSRMVGDRSDPARILEELASVEDLAAYEVDPYIQPTSVENLSIVPSGPLPENPSGILESPYMGIALKALTDAADVVLIDTPPLGATGDALSLAQHVKECVFVVGAGRLEHHEASWAKNLLLNVKADILGVILNMAIAEAREYYYYYRRGRKVRR